MRARGIANEPGRRVPRLADRQTDGRERRRRNARKERAKLLEGTWSPDGRFVVFTQLEASTQYDRMSTYGIFGCLPIKDQNIGSFGVGVRYRF